MFLHLDEKDPHIEAVVDGDGHRVTYGELLSFSNEFYTAVGHRCLLAVLTENTVGACAGYVASMISGIVPLMLSHTLTPEVLSSLFETYHPSFLWVPETIVGNYSYPVCFSKYGYALLRTEYSPYPMADQLALLLPTSGSTGSPKLVRHTLENVESNAAAVAGVFDLSPSSRGMVSLPLNFTQGLNVATSHLFAGGTVLLTRATLTEKAFWSFFRSEKAESFTGVPYSYELLSRLRFFRMDLPALKIINQGGGRMPDELFEQCAQYAADTGRKFIATYGSTETTSRMAYLPAELALSKRGSIGRPLPGRSIVLLDEEGNEVSGTNEVGEIVYHGPNVTLGYATCAQDLMNGDERHGVYATGDMAWRDEDGCYYIVGRKSRFLKLYGYRVGLDESERLIKGQLSIECACVGDDRQMRIYVTDPGKEEEIISLMSEHISVPRTAFSVIHIDHIPKNDAGKTQYKELP